MNSRIGSAMDLQSFISGGVSEATTAMDWFRVQTHCNGLIGQVRRLKIIRCLACVDAEGHFHRVVLDA